MISIAGLPTALALKLVEREEEKFAASIEKNVINAREIKGFRERIGQIQTVDQLVDDYEVYSFVMKAYDLEDQIFGKAMMRKVLKGDLTDRTSLVARMTDTRFKDLHRALGFTDAGTKNPNVQDADWVETLVDRYVETQLINQHLETNEAVGLALHAKRKAPELTTWYSVLADTKLQEFFFTAFGLPDEMLGTDIDAQVKVLQKKLDLSTLNDPGVFEKLTAKFSAMSQAKESQANLSSNPILQLFSNSSSSIVSINLSGLTALNASKYMR